MAAPTLEIDGCRRAHQTLLEHLAGLTDAQVRAQSRLPDWTVGHVLTHLARNADSVIRRLEGAARDVVVDQYPGGYAGRAADIAAGAGRPATELVDDVRDSAYRLEAACMTLPEVAWDRPTRDVSGAQRPARLMVFSRWREVVVHLTDLGLGYTTADWPEDLVAVWLPVQLELLARRADPRCLLAWMVGRAPAPELPPW